jgi:hypothetical protein
LDLNFGPISLVSEQGIKSPGLRVLLRLLTSSTGPREKRHLRDLGATEGHRDYLDSDDLLLFARGVGHTLPKPLNGGFRAACLQKNPQLL